LTPENEQPPAPTDPGKSLPAFLITIDTEGDSLWSNPRTITTRNAGFLPRFQALCESHGLKPTYLTNYEMANAALFRELGRDVLARGTGEIGMHLHAWNSPPLVPLTDDDMRYHPYLIEYPEATMRDKIGAMTELLEQTFGVEMVSHRAGRWSLNATYARLLVERGYRVDCSVTPHVSWQWERGDPRGVGGTDFSTFPDRAYLVDLDNIAQPGDSPLLEVPVTIVPGVHGGIDWVRPLFDPWRFSRRALNYLAPRAHWLRPNGRNRNRMIEILRRAAGERRPYVEFMLHSSELMPGGSRRFPTSRHIEDLYGDLEALFGKAKGGFVGMTLREYRETHAGDVERR
jgi:hypothetical protein